MISTLILMGLSIISTCALIYEYQQLRHERKQSKEAKDYMNYIRNDTKRLMKEKYRLKREIGEISFSDN